MEKALKRIYKNTFKVFFPSAGDIVDAMLVHELKNADRILDLGCGPSSPLGRVKDRLKPGVYMLGVDDFDPYLEKNRRDKIHSEYLKHDILSVDFPKKSFDCAVLLDVIEHFNKDDFLAFLPKLEKIAKKIIIMTPNGFINQNEYDDNAYQIHRSGWTAPEMRKLGFACYGTSGLKWLRGEYALARIRPRLIGNMICNLSEPLVYDRPERAFHLICVKKTE
ncbi:MAG: class I SAM-dependent methyltransferase [Candidatus Pacebacteria bacterium]|nr:class I SAM-dependent methyltransferase [Candidatus Paceibacterota bacterium]